MQSQDVEPSALAGDLLEGAEGIARFLYNDPGKSQAVYHLVRIKAIPTFKIGGKVYARKSVLLGWIAEQERASTNAA